MSASPLLMPLQVGSLKLKNRIILAPLTRSRATGVDGRTPNDLMTEYYVQRSSAGMILSEATSITPMGVGYANTPGIWSQDHIHGWKSITDAVHAKGGIIFMQLWHVGRVSDPIFLDGKIPVSASATRHQGYVHHAGGKKEYVMPRALTTAEVGEVINEYRTAAKNAKEAGFDGVEVHSANGYLLDQFLQDGSNKRTDKYGGSVENRARFLMEVTDALISVWGADRIGVHLSPRGDSHDMGDSNPEKLFSYVAEELGKRKIAFICTREFVGPDSLAPKLKKIFGGVFIGNEKFTVESAAKAVADGHFDAIAFGKDFIANPDFVRRIEIGAPLNTPDVKTFYSSGKEGYTDYPILDELHF